MAWADRDALGGRAGHFYGLVKFAQNSPRRRCSSTLLRGRLHTSSSVRYFCRIGAVVKALLEILASEAAAVQPIILEHLELARAPALGRDRLVGLASPRTGEVFDARCQRRGLLLAVDPAGCERRRGKFRRDAERREDAGRSSVEQHRRGARTRCEDRCRERRGVGSQRFYTVPPLHVMISTRRYSPASLPLPGRIYTLPSACHVSYGPHDHHVAYRCRIRCCRCTSARCTMAPSI